MSKPKRERSLPDNEAKAIGRSVRTSQYKLNRVVESIRGKPVEQALADLTFSPKRIASEVIKVLRAAIANAENNQNLDVDELVVAQAWTGKNMILKRFHARARGRGTRIEKPFSELTIIVREQAPEDKKEKSKSKTRRGGKPAPAKKEAA
ncbi:MAG: 50S ribosomal protein L22 [Alphaproteobacteria bacterium]|nr:50S ribosomal protein L22 [Alphaproteobacteria bacterium]